MDCPEMVTHIVHCWRQLSRSRSLRSLEDTILAMRFFFPHGDNSSNSKASLVPISTSVGGVDADGDSVVSRAGAGPAFETEAG